MQAFPPASDLEFLVGREIGQICLNPWSVQFRFSEGGYIAVEGAFEHVDIKGEVHRHQDSYEQDRGQVALRELIQRRVTKIEVSAHCLALFMEEGGQLKIFSEDSPYEDGQIYPEAQSTRPIVF